MASLTQVPWSKGKYDSYTLQSDGSLVGTIHPPGFAWLVTEDNKNLSSDMIFLSSRNQLCKGNWFIAALIPTKFKAMKTGIFSSRLVLVMGAKVTAKTLLQRQVLIYYYKMRPNLSVGATTDLFNSSPSITTFISTLFEPCLTVGSESTNLRYLNQIAGPTLPSWKLLPSIAEVDGLKYHQVRSGPDSWYDRPHILKEIDGSVVLTKPSYSLWQPDTQQYITTTNNPYVKKIIQHLSSKVLVIYTERMPSFGTLMWMPLPDLPNTPSHNVDFALITMDQKLEIDSQFTEADSLMDPKEFRDLLLDMTISNGFPSFIRLTKLSCGSLYLGEKCMMFIVSIVSRTDMATLILNNFSSSMSGIQGKKFELLDNNTTDCDIAAGTVVFRGYKFRTECNFGKEEVALVMAAYHTSFKRFCTHNQGSFHMLQERQSNISSRSMGVASDRKHHHYFNDTNMNATLVPLTTPMINMLNRVTTQVQNTTGQVVIGIVKEAMKRAYNWQHIQSDQVCGYGIMTCPRIHKTKGVLESFANCGHRDKSDCIGDDQGHIVSNYIRQLNSKALNKYMNNMYSTFKDVISPPDLVLPTSCGWKLIEDPSEYSFVHKSYFIVSEAGIAWDLSSPVLANIGEVGGTFFGKLVEHVTSCSLYQEESSGWVTTLCPGDACNFAWGTSGGKNKLKMMAGLRKRKSNVSLFQPSSNTPRRRRRQGK